MTSHEGRSSSTPLRHSPAPPRSHDVQSAALRHGLPAMHPCCVRGELSWQCAPGCRGHGGQAHREWRTLRREGDLRPVPPCWGAGAAGCSRGGKRSQRGERHAQDERQHAGQGGAGEEKGGGGGSARGAELPTPREGDGRPYRPPGSFVLSGTPPLSARSHPVLARGDNRTWHAARTASNAAATAVCLHSSSAAPPC